MEVNKNFISESTNSILLVLKNLIMLFACVIVYQSFPHYWTNLQNQYGSIDVKAVIFALAIVITIYVVWLLVNIYIIRKWLNNTVLGLLEILFYNAVIALPICFAHAYDSEFKYIFLLVIIATIIQYGLRYGVFSALVSTAIIWGIDLAYGPNINNINSYFENDLILAGVFVLVAWILGYYVDLENANNKAKENELNLLNNELQEQSNQRKNIEDLLLKNNVCFDILFENSQNAILVHKDNKFIYVNESAAKLLGYEEKIILNEKKISDFYAEDVMEKQNERYAEIISSKLSKVIHEETIINASGKPITVRSTSSFFVYEGQSAVLTFLLDITTEKQLETLKNDAEKNLKLLNESREFNALITEFFINMSHEIKTPINIIYVAIQAIGVYLDSYNGKNMNKCNEYLKTMKQNCFRMIRLVNNLLDITKYDSGFMKLDRRNGNIVTVIEDITQSVATYVKSKDIELIFDTDVEEKITAFDADKIERIMLNLLSNAFKYSQRGGRIEVNFTDKGSELLISVKDNGEGISEESLEIIFQRFGQANRSLSRKYEGSGIGLYLVKSFVEMHNGKITVRSEEGKGTEFEILLPVEHVEEANSYDGSSIFEANIERINIEFSDIYT
ncbi:MAG: ATP-binding protein [Bacillota bacterium]|nr:ATP-binding protein [Bacillota bacterium]